MGAIAVLSVLLVAGIARTRSAASNLRCLANLKAIGTGLTVYAMDNSMHFPAPTALGQSWESLIRRYTGPSTVFACPADQELFPSIGSSYDWRDTSLQTTTLDGKLLGGDRGGPYRPNAVLALETLPGWHHEHQMNALLLNGSTLTMVDEDCLKDLETSVYLSSGRQ